MIPKTNSKIKVYKSRLLLIVVVMLYMFGNWVLAYEFDAKKTVSEQIFQIESLYNRGQYQQTIEAIHNIFLTQKSITESLLVRLYTYQGFAYVALGNRDDALNSFRYLRIINPNIQLDPKLVSPKIIEIFEESRRIKGDSLKNEPVFTRSEPAILNEKMARQRLIRSLLYPGLGQIYAGKKTTGYFFLGAETVSIVGLVASHFLTNAAHQKYLDARTPTEIEDRYQNYAFWYRVRIGLCISSVSIWVLNYIHATLAD